MRYLYLVLFFMLSACTSGEKSNVENENNVDAKSLTDSLEDSGDDAMDGEDAGECWWCVDTSTPDVTQMIEEGKGETKGDLVSMVWVGTWSEEKEEGVMDITLSTDSGKTLLCDFSFPVASGAKNEDCAECAFAWDFILGEGVGTLDGSGCELLHTFDGSNADFGHASSGSLYTRKNDDWSIIDDGSSTFEDGIWKFEFTYFFGDEGGKGEAEKDKGDEKEGEECYDACIAKGQSEEVCATACDDDDSQSALDEECYDACIAKGASDEVCAEACSQGGADKADGERGEGK